MWSRFQVANDQCYVIFSTVQGTTMVLHRRSTGLGTRRRSFLVLVGISISGVTSGMFSSPVQVRTSVSRCNAPQQPPSARELGRFSSHNNNLTPPSWMIPMINSSSGVEIGIASGCRHE